MTYLQNQRAPFHTAQGFTAAEESLCLSQDAKLLQRNDLTPPSPHAIPPPSTPNPAPPPLQLLLSSTADKINSTVPASFSVALVFVVILRFGDG